MATYSEIYISFIANTPLNTTLSFMAGTEVLSAVWVSNRVASGQIEVGVPTSLAGQRAAINYMAAFVADHNALDVYEVTVTGITVTIKSKNPLINFSNFITNAASGTLVASIDNYSASTYLVTSVVFGTAILNQFNTHYSTIVTTSILTIRVTGDVTILANAINPFSFELPRNVGFNILLRSIDGQEITLVYLDEEVPQLIPPLPEPDPEVASSVRYRIGVGKAGDNLTNAESIIKTPAFTFDRDDITFDTTLRTFDEIPV